MSTPGLLAAADLVDRRLGVGGRRVGHRLDGDRRVAADGDVADHDLAGLAALDVAPGTKGHGRHIVDGGRERQGRSKNRGFARNSVINPPSFRGGAIAVNRFTPIASAGCEAGPRRPQAAAIGRSSATATTIRGRRPGSTTCSSNIACPKALVGSPTHCGPIPKRWRPIFRDRQELAASSDLGAKSRRRWPLRASSSSCARRRPRSRAGPTRKSAFKRLHREDRVLAAILDGEPFAE